MARPTPAYTVEQMYTALDANDGFFFRAARTLGCSESTIERYVAKHSRLRELVKQHRGHRVDEIEDVLFDKAQAGEPWAVIFYLKTQAKHRGYTERQEFRFIKELTDDELIEAIKKRTGGDASDDARGGTPGAEPKATLH